MQSEYVPIHEQSGFLPWIYNTARRFEEWRRTPHDSQEAWAQLEARELREGANFAEQSHLNKLLLKTADGQPESRQLF